MRVLMVNDLAPGPGSGVEVHLARLIDGLEAAGDAVEAFGGEIRHSGARKALDVWDPLARRELARRAARFRPDVVHYHHVVRELSASVLGAPVGRAARVITVHDNRLVGVPDSPRSAVIDRARLWKNQLDLAMARRHVDATIAVSPDLAAKLQSAGFRRVEVIPPFAPRPAVDDVVPVESCTDVVYAGRLTREKGVEVLVSAMAEVTRQLPSSQLVLVGDGPLRGELTDSAGVRVAGPMDEEGVRREMGRARVVAVPSLASEGAPNVIVEAALLGRPVVATDQPTLRELVNSLGCGIIVPRGVAASLAHALLRLLSEDGLARRLGATARQHAEARHVTDVAVSRVRDVYADLQR